MIKYDYSDKLFDIGTPNKWEMIMFESKFIRGREDECWNWLAYKGKGGHGQFRYRGKIVYAYRFMYALVNGPFLDILNIAHHCDNGACVNPKHLFSATFVENIITDKCNKGRQAKGESLSCLKEEQIKEIYRLAKEGIYTQKTIGLMFNIDASQVSRILNGRRWQHLKLPEDTTILAQ